MNSTRRTMSLFRGRSDTAKSGKDEGLSMQYVVKVLAGKHDARIRIESVVQGKKWMVKRASG